MMVLSDTIHVMLLKHDFYSTFTGKPIADAHQIEPGAAGPVGGQHGRGRCDDRQGRRGRRGRPTGPKQDMGGLMYGRSFEDPDGHHWEVMWMDAEGRRAGRVGV